MESQQIPEVAWKAVSKQVQAEAKKAAVNRKVPKGNEAYDDSRRQMTLQSWGHCRWNLTLQGEEIFQLTNVHAH